MCPLTLARWALWAPLPPEAETTEQVVEAVTLAAECFDALTLAEWRYLQGPIVLPTQRDVCPPRLRVLIPQARLALLRTGEKHLATLEETLAYLAYTSQKALFLWLGQQVWTKWYPAMLWPTVSTPQLASLTALRRQLRRAVLQAARRA